MFSAVLYSFRLLLFLLFYLNQFFFLFQNQNLCVFVVTTSSNALYVWPLQSINPLKCCIHLLLPHKMMHTFPIDAFPLLVPPRTFEHTASTAAACQFEQNPKEATTHFSLRLWLIKTVSQCALKSMIVINYSFILSTLNRLLLLMFLVFVESKLF